MNPDPQIPPAQVNILASPGVQRIASESLRRRTETVAIGHPVFAERLKRLRMRRKLTQTALASAADVLVDTLKEIERGKAEPAWSVALRLAQALGVAVTEFVSETSSGKCDDTSSGPASTCA